MTCVDGDVKPYSLYTSLNTPLIQWSSPTLGTTLRPQLSRVVARQKGVHNRQRSQYATSHLPGDETEERPTGRLKMYDNHYVDRNPAIS